MADGNAPYHPRTYYAADQPMAAEALRDAFLRLSRAENDAPVLFIGRTTDGGVGPHPIPQYEVQFLERYLPAIVSAIEAAGVRALTTM